MAHIDEAKVEYIGYKKNQRKFPKRARAGRKPDNCFDCTDYVDDSAVQFKQYLLMDIVFSVFTLILAVLGIEVEG